MSTCRQRIGGPVMALALALGATACGQDAPGQGSQGSGGGALATAATAGTASGESATAAVISPAQQAANEAQVRADLAADIEDRVADARREFGNDVPLRAESGLFVVVAAEHVAAFDEAADFAQRALDVYLGSFFARRPDRAVTVELVRSTTAFMLRCIDHNLGTSCGHDLGAYALKSRTIIVNIGPGLPSISHELIHPLVQTDFPRIPEWFDEGIGALFEMPVFEPAGEMHGVDNWRYEKLVHALHSAERAKVHLPALFGLDYDSFTGEDQALHYSEARALCQWLDERGQLWPFYRAWREAVATDPTGEKSFEQVTGMTPAQADETWLTWAKARSWPNRKAPKR